jgi:phage FluMu gp28-like protein
MAPTADSISPAHAAAMATPTGVPAPASRPASVIEFDPSQRRLFTDRARVIVVNWHRQKGKDFTAAAKAVDQAMMTGQSWYIVAMTQAQADETFAKCRKVADGAKALLKRMYGSDRVDEEAESYVDYDRQIDHAFQATARILRLPNGGRVVSLPGRNPDTLAGRSGNLILTEFGLYPGGGYAHWEVLFPIVTRGGYRLVVISTPRGRNTKFYELFTNADGFYSVHFCDIRKSVFEDGYVLYDAQGQPFPTGTDEEKELAIATFRRIYNSESKWPREYECQFTGDLSSLIPWAELERAAQLGDGLPFDWLQIERDGSPLGPVWHALKSEAAAGVRPEVGWDVARRGNLSALTLNLARPNRPKHLRFVVTMKGVDYATQRSFVQAVMRLGNLSVGYGDATGLGNESNEVLAGLYPDRWTPFMFTASGKRELASSLRTAFSDAAQTLPSLKTHKAIATDLYAIQKDDTGANLTLEETANPLLPDSHCDVAYSLGLNRLAGARNTVMPLPVGGRRPVGL